MWKSTKPRDLIEQCTCVGSLSIRLHCCLPRCPQRDPNVAGFIVSLEALPCQVAETMLPRSLLAQRAAETTARAFPVDRVAPEQDLHFVCIWLLLRPPPPHPLLVVHAPPACASFGTFTSERQFVWGKRPKLMVRTLTHPTKMLRFFKANADVMLKLWSVAPHVESACFVILTNVAWVARYGDHSQGGYVILACHASVLDGQECKRTIFAWEVVQVASVVHVLIARRSTGSRCNRGSTLIFEGILGADARSNSGASERLNNAARRS